MSGQARYAERVEGSMHRQSGFTLLELLVVVSIIALLVGILVPSLAAARQQSKKATCLANLRSIGQGIQSYLNENGDRYPYAASFPSAAAQVANLQNRDPYPPLPEVFAKQLDRVEEVFRCPSDKNTMVPELGTSTYFEHEGTSYEWLSQYNGKKVDRDALSRSLGPSDAPMIWDFEPFHGGPKRIGSHHVLFADLVAREDNWSDERHYFYTD